MDFFNNQPSTDDDNDELYSQYSNQCETFYWSRKFFSEPVDTSKMSSEVFCLYQFNQKILDLTDEMIEGLLSIGDLQNIVTEECLFFSIIDPSDCTTLNKYCLNFNFYFISYQKRFIRSQKRRDYIELLDSVLIKFQSFVSSTLPILERNIDNLIFKVRRIEKKKLKIEFKKVENMGNKVNGIIFEYLKDLYQTVTEFKITNVPLEISERKNIIKDMIKNTFENKSIAMGIPVIKKTTTTNASPVTECRKLNPFDFLSEIEDEDFEVGETESQAEMIYDQGNPFSHSTENYKQLVSLNSHKSFIDEEFNNITAEDNNLLASQTNLTVIVLFIGAVVVLCSMIVGFMKYRLLKRKRRTEAVTQLDDDEKDHFKEYFISK